MPLPTNELEAIFTKLVLVYGWQRLFGTYGQYADMKADQVKGHWAHELQGFRPEAITYALQNLPADTPPNVLQFKAICNRAPELPPLKALAPPKASPAHVQRVQHKLAALLQKSSDPTRNLVWNAERLREREERGELLCELQREFWRKVLGRAQQPQEAEE